MEKPRPSNHSLKARLGSPSALTRASPGGSQPKFIPRMESDAP